MGVSFAFLKDFLGENQIISPALLFWGWLFLVLSLASVLFSLFFATFAYKESIKEIDNESEKQTKLPMILSKITLYLHSSGAIFLLLGLLFIGSFTFKNIGIYADEQSTEANVAISATNSTERAR